MADMQTVTLEILRPGPPHNQLLSPLTPYMALCGEGGPVTFHLEFEHRQLLNRLERLRYVADGELVAESIRQAEVQELGALVARILSQIPSVLAEVSRANRGRSGVLHVRLVMSGSELSLIPFELTNAPEGFPGERLEMLLQTSTPITLTREIRRGRALPVVWNRRPKILFVFAEPQGHTVPYREHLHELRKAIEPWVKWPGPGEDRVIEVKKHLTVLPNASLESVRQECARGGYTHVHILAHGIPYLEAREQRYGLALCGDSGPTELDVVSGKRLAQALRANLADGTGRSEPAVVTLATCDSGAEGSVLVPGGSIAHDLHSYGVPWVIASQFPLTKTGSITVIGLLYSRLLRGDDPRLVLHDARHQLYVNNHQDHDWASLVGYASLPEDFALQLVTFREQQTRCAIDTAFEGAEKRPKSQMDMLEKVDQHLARWLAMLPDDDSLPSRQQKAECFGNHGASRKRSAEIYRKQSDTGLPGADVKARSALQEGRHWYKKALRGSHWNATQYLSLTAVLNEASEPELLAGAKAWALTDLDDSNRSNRAWAYGSLAELEMLGVYHIADAEADKVKARVREYCQELVHLMGPGSFHAYSTRRQFERYLNPEWDNDLWRDIAQAAVDELKAGADS